MYCMKRILFVGAAGSGKTTISTEIFTELKKQNLKVELVHEWVRYDIQSNGPLTTIYEQFRTIYHQKYLEDSVPQNVDYIITDSGTLTPYFYACLYINQNNARERIVLQDMYKMLMDDIFLKRYDYVFYLPLKYNNSINMNDGTRFQNFDQTKILDTHMNTIFNVTNKMNNIYTIDVDLKERKSKILEIIK